MAQRYVYIFEIRTNKTFEELNEEMQHDIKPEIEGNGHMVKEVYVMTTDLFDELKDQRMV